MSLLQLIPGDDFGTEMAEFLTEADKGLGLIVSTEKQMKDEFAKVRAFLFFRIGPSARLLLPS